MGKCEPAFLGGKKPHSECRYAVEGAGAGGRATAAAADTSPCTALSHCCIALSLPPVGGLLPPHWWCFTKKKYVCEGGINRACGNGERRGRAVEGAAMLEADFFESVHYVQFYLFPSHGILSSFSSQENRVQLCFAAGVCFCIEVVPEPREGWEASRGGVGPPLPTRRGGRTPPLYLETGFQGGGCLPQYRRGVGGYLEKEV